MSGFRSTVVTAAILLIQAWFSPARAQDSFWDDLTFNQSNDLTGVSFITDSKGSLWVPTKRFM